MNPRLEADPETRKVNVTFAIDEGPRVYIERINIVGNTSTLDRVIRRELRVAEGDAFNRVLLDRSRNVCGRSAILKRLRLLSAQGRGRIEPSSTWQVKEQATGELSFAAVSLPLMRS